MSDSFLSQEEIDALLNQGGTSEKPVRPEEKKEDSGAGNTPKIVEMELQELERDALGEIANISMGSAATTLSTLLNQRVDITTPKVKVVTEKELYDSFELPYVIVEVNFDEGLRGSNLLILKVRDASVIADLMMGGDGSNADENLSEISTSAVSEAMNQMIGSAATSMSDMFQKGIKISPPNIKPVDFKDDSYDSPITNGKVVVVSFRMVVGTMIDSELMQIIPLDIAKEEVNLLMSGEASSAQEFQAQEFQADESINDEEVVQKEDEQQNESQVSLPSTEALKVSLEEQQNLNLILDVPLKVSVILGRTKRPIGEILAFANGSIIELEKLADESVDILVNGTLIARGEVVVVNENFGVRIKSILTPEERINNLRG